ncbi:hypothetical protein ACSLBF_13025 [Pseudoalteromonas sp. T1lg65]|uniref:hypothetical protein n=1 Tax=Pseudoalteromonas sp. T1lg65 TaxID=2077101 RepID=UPI003F78B553
MTGLQGQPRQLTDLLTCKQKIRNIWLQQHSLQYSATSAPSSCCSQLLDQEYDLLPICVSESQLFSCKQLRLDNEVTLKSSSLLIMVIVSRRNTGPMIAVFNGSELPYPRLESHEVLARLTPAEGCWSLLNRVFSAGGNHQIFEQSAPQVTKLDLGAA